MQKLNMKIELMKINVAKYKLTLRFFSLLILTTLLTSCHNDIVDISLNVETFNKNSKVTSLIKSTTSTEVTNSAEQCVDYIYPITFYAYYSNSQSIETIVVNSDQELFDFFDHLTSTDEISIDFPVVLTNSDGEETIINDLTALEGTLQIVVDACSGGSNNNYDYCDNNQKKVYICHNGQTICVSIHAVWAHLNNHEEDYLGKCN